MKPVRSRVGRVLPLLVILVGVVFARSRDDQPISAAPPASRTQPPGGPDANTPALKPPSLAPVSALDLSPVTDPSHRDQIVRVVEAVDRTGAPPRGVAQGGRRGARKGVFQNAEGRLPRQPRGYWVESDVWPKNGPRDAERLIFGRGHEVYWTQDHYETFVRLR